jgi:ABC-type transporter Mla MlaB component
MADSGQSQPQQLVFTGELCIQQAEELHQSLIQALEQTQWLEVDLSEARNVGLCCLQLLCSASRSARDQGKRLTIGPGVSSEFEQAVFRAGFPSQRGGAVPEDAGCLWIMEDEQ